MSDVARTALDLVFAGGGGRTTLTRRRYRWPLLIGRVFPDSSCPGMGSVTIQSAAGTLIPGDDVMQRIAVVDGGYAVVRGQGATTVAGIPGGDAAAEHTDVYVDASSRLTVDAAPRILTPYAHYRQRTHVRVAPGGRAVLVDAVVLHPELRDGVFGSYESSVEVTAAEGRLIALDVQQLESTPRVRRAPTAFGSVYVLGAGLDEALTALTPDLEALAVLSGDRTVYVGASDLPNGAGWTIRIAASDGGVLRAAIRAVTVLVDSAACHPRISVR